MDGEGLGIEPLVDEDCVVALPRQHKLANLASIGLTELASEKFILFQREFSPAVHDSIFAACEKAGFRPKVEQEVGQIISIVPVVAAGFGVSIVPRSFSEVHFGGIRYLDIDGEAPRSALALVYRRDERSAAVKNLLKAARLAKLRG